jgi:hypothetical protein
MPDGGTTGAADGCGAVARAGPEAHAGVHELGRGGPPREGGDVPTTGRHAGHVLGVVRPRIGGRPATYRLPGDGGSGHGRACRPVMGRAATGYGRAGHGEDVTASPGEGGHWIWAR